MPSQSRSSHHPQGWTPYATANSVSSECPGMLPQRVLTAHSTWRTPPPPFAVELESTQLLNHSPLPLPAHPSCPGTSPTTASCASCSHTGSCTACLPEYVWTHIQHRYRYMYVWEKGIHLSVSIPSLLKLLHFISPPASKCSLPLSFIAKARNGALQPFLSQFYLL